MHMQLVKDGRNPLQCADICSVQHVIAVGLS